jgi:glycosyltransferase involved in cell wall biosynthesis
MVSISNPGITVVIPTYNWSSALRCAIRSVLLQTVQDFEVLVVGDGCTDDSAAVVAEFDDPRLRWHNLSQNYGSQWAANNFANENAAGDWIAYLGHDDVWYPTHLEAILRTAQKTSAEIVSSVMIEFGPAGSGIRGVAGVFPTGNFSSRDFVPPSAFAHKRSIGKIVKWRDPYTIVAPTDAAFLNDAAATSRVASTGELTCFKFNAAFRRDSYKIKSIAEQERILKLIESGVEFRQQVYLELIEAFVAGKAHHGQMPRTIGVPEGGFARRNRRAKGLDSRYDQANLRHIDRLVRFDTAHQNMPFEWHQLENHPKYGSLRWTGPSPRATIDLPIVFDRDLAVRIHIVFAVRDAIETLKLSIHEQEIAHRVDRLPEGTILVTAYLDHAAIAKPKRDFGVTLEIANTMRPWDLGELYQDSRWLGLAVNWVELEPVRA